MLGHKGQPSRHFGQKAVPPFSHIGGLHKGQMDMMMAKKAKEMVAQAPKYGSLEKK